MSIRKDDGEMNISGNNLIKARYCFSNIGNVFGMKNRTLLHFRRVALFLVSFDQIINKDLRLLLIDDGRNKMQDHDNLC